MGIWARLGDVLARHGRAAMVTVVGTRGSAPREAGARLIIDPDGGFTGTIGGGTLEWRAIAMAQARLADRTANRAESRTFLLGPDMGQCCGGQVELLVEVFSADDGTAVAAFAEREEAGPFTTSGAVTATTGVVRTVTEDETLAPGRARMSHGVLTEGFGEERRTLLLFGAGHVGRALALALAPLPFTVKWFDPRPDAFPAFLPAHVTTGALDDPAEIFAAAPDGAFVLVMTHSHQLDLALVGAAFSEGRFPYVGLIGSKSKRVRFERRLAQAGISQAQISTLVCPIGVGGIHSKLPAAIAAATVAELLVRDEALRAETAPIEGAHDRLHGQAG